MTRFLTPLALIAATALLFTFSTLLGRQRSKLRDEFGALTTNLGTTVFVALAAAIYQLIAPIERLADLATRVNLIVGGLALAVVVLLLFLSTKERLARDPWGSTIHEFLRDIVIAPLALLAVTIFTMCTTHTTPTVRIGYPSGNPALATALEAPRAKLKERGILVTLVPLDYSLAKTHFCTTPRSRSPVDIVIIDEPWLQQCDLEPFAPPEHSGALLVRSHQGAGDGDLIRAAPLFANVLGYWTRRATGVGASAPSASSASPNGRIGVRWDSDSNIAEAFFFLLFSHGGTVDVDATGHMTIEPQSALDGALASLATAVGHCNPGTNSDALRKSLLDRSIDAVVGWHAWSARYRSFWQVSGEYGVTDFVKTSASITGHWYFAIRRRRDSAHVQEVAQLLHSDWFQLEILPSLGLIPVLDGPWQTRSASTPPGSDLLLRTPTRSRPVASDWNALESSLATWLKLSLKCSTNVPAPPPPFKVKA